jgi:hypothetical protein
MVRKMLCAVSAVVLCIAAVAAAGNNSDVNAPALTRFTAGGWDPAQWTGVRMANQPSPKAIVQLKDGIGTTGETFSNDDYAKECDNALLLHDLHAPDAEIEVTFTIGRGFSGASCPGICLAPSVRDGLMDSSIAIFVADYTMAVWYQDTAPDGKTVRYRHLAQLARHSDPARRHVLRCRYSIPEASIALKLDDADPVAFCFIGNPALSFVERKLNTVVGLWGCHGACTFHEMSVRVPGRLPFMVR